MTLRMALAVAFALLLGAGTAPAQMGRPGGGMGSQIQKYYEQMGLPKEFSVKVEMQGRGMSMPSTLTTKGEKTRMEMAGGPMGQMVMISDRKAKKNYMLMPATKTYMEMPMMEPQGNQDEKADEAKVTIKELGEEQKEGHPCTKRLITIAGKGQDQATEMTVWNAKDMQNLPVRMEMGAGEEKMAMVYRDYNLKSPDDSLFEVPADYKKQAGFGGMMPPQANEAADEK